MGHVVALSDVTLVGLLGFAGVVVTAIGGIIVAALGREVQNRRRTVNRTVADFEDAWAARGRLLDGLGADLDAAHRRIADLERREDECQAELAVAHARLDELEETIAGLERRRRPR